MAPKYPGPIYKTRTERKYPSPIYKTRTERIVVAWAHRCAYCGRIFRSKLRRAKYCPQSSGRFCRNKAHRESKR